MAHQSKSMLPIVQGRLLRPKDSPRGGFGAQRADTSTTTCKRVDWRAIKAVHATDAFCASVLHERYRSAKLLQPNARATGATTARTRCVLRRSSDWATRDKFSSMEVALTHCVNAALWAEKSSTAGRAAWSCGGDTNATRVWNCTLNLMHHIILHPCIITQEDHYRVDDISRLPSEDRHEFFVSSANSRAYE